MVGNLSDEHVLKVDEIEAESNPDSDPVALDSIINVGKRLVIPRRFKSIRAPYAPNKFKQVWSWMNQTHAKSTASATATRWPSLDQEIADQLKADYRHQFR